MIQRFWNFSHLLRKTQLKKAPARYIESLAVDIESVMATVRVTTRKVKAERPEDRFGNHGGCFIVKS
jgi:hypothetical protein